MAPKSDSVTVFIPALLRDLTGGLTSLTTGPGTVRQILATLDTQYPGLAARLAGPHTAFAIDGEITSNDLDSVPPGSELHFVTAISGG